MGKYKNILQHDEVPAVVGIGMFASAVFGAMFTFIPMNEEETHKTSEAGSVLTEAFQDAGKVLREEGREFIVSSDQVAQSTLSSLQDISGRAETEEERIARFNAFAEKRDQLLDLLATDRLVGEGSKELVLRSLREADVIPEGHPAYNADAYYMQECQTGRTNPDEILQCTAQMADEFDDGRAGRGTPFGAVFLLLALAGIGRGITKPKEVSKPRYRH